MTIRSKPLDRDHGYHQPNLLTMIMTEDDLLRKLKDTTTSAPARKTTPGRGGLLLLSALVEPGKTFAQ
jgi:hypothetical protein